MNFRPRRSRGLTTRNLVMSRIACRSSLRGVHETQADEMIVVAVGINVSTEVVKHRGGAGREGVGAVNPFITPERIGSVGNVVRAFGDTIVGEPGSRAGG